MDPRNRADDTLAHARARGAFVVTPDSATSPMDASSTVRIPRELIDEADRDPDSTVVLPHSSPQEPSPQTGSPSAEPPGTEWPSEDHDRVQHGAPHIDARHGRGMSERSEHGHPHDPPPQHGQLPRYGRPPSGELRYDSPRYGQLQHGWTESPQAQSPQSPGYENAPPNPYGSQGTSREPAPSDSPTARQYPASPR
ncbi:hypothetical protein DFQ14_11732 [Halopolyspora algeriensis]|uniref:Uncharacterized protein n=1 Tax=Halopolyspora algeriensis TaxID=1500506 RepID=A0A368VDL5_9ACTN|nr:hypothetical protein [Halopolyspora algeriensis]RCW39196.1 hypothetical protein DFQ14_11732 [Halopolyspora algeriensis]TQM47437.1 hypothetical protein FHU43_3425 [Halopolyspora algeriensis]